MSKTVTPGAILSLLSNPSPDSGLEKREIIVQVVDLKPIGSSTSRFTFNASDGKMKIKAMLPTNFSSEINSGRLQNLGIIQILDYTCNTIPNQPDKALIVTKCEVISSALEFEIKCASEDVATLIKPKQENEPKSVAEIIHEQRINSAPVTRFSMVRRVHPLCSLNPYQGNWTIKVRVTNKGDLRTYKNQKGEGRVFNVELTDEDGTQIQATMFNEAANKFFQKFDIGKVYYISKGTLRLANRQFKTVQNDYEMNLNENSIVEEAQGESSFIPETKYNFVKIDKLGSYVNGTECIDVIGVVKSVSMTASIRRKINNEMIPKRDIILADESNMTVSVTLWSDHATVIGEQLLDMVNKAPVLAIKTLKVGDFQGASLSTLSKSIVQINPDLPETKALRTWYDSEGKEVTMAPIGSTLNSISAKAGQRSMYNERVNLSDITNNQTLGQEKPVFYTIKAYVSFIKHDQMMWYRACKACNKKVTDAVGSGFWCEACQKNDDGCSLRYIMVMKLSDSSGEAWVSVFNDHAEKIIGYSADELNRIRDEDGEEKFQLKLKEATWIPQLFRVSVAISEYMNEKRQRITVRAQSPIDCTAEMKHILEEISKLAVS